MGISDDSLVNTNYSTMEEFVKAKQYLNGCIIES